VALVYQIQISLTTSASEAEHVRCGLWTNSAGAGHANHEKTFQRKDAKLQRRGEFNR
jgi:hypothetical protein